MRKFMFKTDTSDKFWNIELQGNSYTVTFGRVGTNGRSQSKSFASPAEAQAAQDRIIAEKVKEGYVEMTTGGGAQTVGAKLEAAILDDPDNRPLYGALADWLMEQSDPRGEFIQVQLDLEDEKRPAAERKKLKKREEELLKAHREEWVGTLAAVPAQEPWIRHGNVDLPGPIPVRFIRGCLAQATFEVLTVNQARAFIRAPQTRMVWRLAIGQSAWADDDEHEPGPDVPEDAVCPGLHPLFGWPGLAHLRFFQYGWEPQEDGQEDHFNCHTSAEDAVDLVKRMPRLEELRLFATRLETGPLFGLKTLEHLRFLQIYHCYQCDLARLARNPAFGRLTHLLLHPHGLDHEEPYISLSGVRALVKSPHLKSLTHLRLRLSDMGDAGCEAIAQSGILERLRGLDLRHGTITDEGAKALAASPHIGRLKVLDLTNNRLTAKGERVLRQVVPGLQARRQRDPLDENDDDRMWLYEGDPE